MNNYFRSIRYDIPLHFVLLLCNWLPDNVIFLRLRGFLAAPFFGSCGKDLRLGRNLTFYNSSNMHIGKNVYIAEGNWFSCKEKIQIGDEVIFGPKSVITSSNHTYMDNSYRYGKSIARPISIQKGCWVAANCTITAGTEIGTGTLIAANSVTKGQIPSLSIYGGVPGKIIKSIHS
ncbi:acyltransferase [uncultured Sphingobacterium sp.]|uniref:acyltransferase n=1 Tax=uncultured Sphingobacterium sp. TaxID=182688 RepID=UPI003747BD2A